MALVSVTRGESPGARAMYFSVAPSLYDDHQQRRPALGASFCITSSIPSLAFLFLAFLFLASISLAILTREDARKPTSLSPHLTCVLSQHIRPIVPVTSSRRIRLIFPVTSCISSRTAGALAAPTAAMARGKKATTPAAVGNQKKISEMFTAVPPRVRAAQAALARAPVAIKATEATKAAEATEAAGTDNMMRAIRLSLES
jgi:hypothetical protein